MQALRKKQRQLLLLIQTQSQQQLGRSIALYIALLILAVGGRAALQGIPSVEPMSAISLIVGMLFGSRVGFMFGAKAMFLSNFVVFGGQGPWTIFQALGMGIGGFLGGFLKDRKVTFVRVASVTLLATVIYEVIVNLGWFALFPFSYSLLALSFVTAIPFSLMHIASNLSFSALIPKSAKRLEDLISLDKYVGRIKKA